jgi:Family of unknown function (DUF6527)
MIPDAGPHWAGRIEKITGFFYLCWGEDNYLYTYHWCESMMVSPHWEMNSTGKHWITTDLEGKTTLSPSLWFNECCGLHGFVVNGKWVSA